MLNKTLLGSAAVIMTMVGAQAADLPSKKAAPATYVKICDAYGAGFFFIPGTETCVKLGGYVRYELQYTPGKDLIVPNATSAAAATSTANARVAGANIVTAKETQDTYGTEYRGRITVDARTPTAYGTARTVIALRGTGVTGLNKAQYAYTTGTIAPTLGGTNAELVTEQAFIQWAGFTAGIAGSNYAMIPSMTYKGNIWAGFPNGMRQLSYTAVLGGGFSATLALEDKQMWGNDTASTSPATGMAANTILNRPDTAIAPVANIRLDQSWGFAAVHGVIAKHSLSNSATPAADASTAQLGFQGNSALVPALSTNPVTKTGWGIGTTVSYKLDMIAKGDQVWLTANYMNGFWGALMGAGSITSPSDGSSGGRTLGGVIRKDANVVFTGVNAAGVNTGYDTPTGWNVGGQFLHYWAPQWRSVFTAGYAEINPPTQQQAAALAWGKGTVAEGRGSIIYSPTKDFDIGLELQYLRNTNKLQNTATVTAGSNGAAWVAQGHPGLNNDNWTGKFRVERAF